MSYLSDPSVCKDFEDNTLGPIKRAISHGVGIALTDSAERQDVLDALDFLDVKLSELVTAVRQGKELVLNNPPKEPANV